MLAGTLCGVEMALALAGVPFQRGGVDAAMDSCWRLRPGLAARNGASRWASAAA